MSNAISTASAIEARPWSIAFFTSRQTSASKPGGALDAGDITANGVTVVVYSSAASAWSLLNPKAPLVLGSAAFRGVGTDTSDLPEIVNGAGQFGAAVDVAHKSLNNLTGPGIQRTTWASVALAGATGAVAGAFNGVAVARNAVGLYTITFPPLAGVYQVAIDLDVTVSATGFNAGVVSGTRSNTQVQISTMQGNSGMDAFDPDRITVSIHSIVKCTPFWNKASAQGVAAIATAAQPLPLPPGRTAVVCGRRQRNHQVAR